MNDLVLDGKLRPLVECLLFVAGGPLKVDDVARTLEITPAEAESALEGLLKQYENEGGIQIIRVAQGYQMVTNPDYAEYVARFLAVPPKQLSKAALETLAIIAYQQPITSAEVEAIRGVDSGGVLHTLSERGLVQEVGRKETPGKPILYGTTERFLHYFALRDLSELPNIEELSEPQENLPVNSDHISTAQLEPIAGSSDAEESSES